VPAGDITRQEPEEGTKLAKGETVKSGILGRGKVEVPDVVGKTQVAAAQELGALD